MPEDAAETCDTTTAKMGAPANLQHADQLHDGGEPTRASSKNRVGEVIDEAHGKQDSLVGVLNEGTAQFEFGTELHTEDDLLYGIDSGVAEPGACLLVPPETRPKNEKLVESNGSGPKSNQCDGVLTPDGKFEAEFAGGLEPLSRENSSIESSADDRNNDELENKPTVGVQGSALIHDKVESCSGALYSNDAISSSFMAAMENLSKDFNRRIYETKMTFDSDESKCSSGSLNYNVDNHIRVRSGEPSDSFIISESTTFSQENSGSSGVWNNGGAGQIMDGETGNAEVNVTGINIKSLSQYNKKSEVNISKKVALSKFPSNVTEFLGTGLLDGCPVRYINPGEQKILHGTIKEGGFLCSCSSCNGTKIITALDFEHHAGFLTRHAYSYIFVPNGMRLYTAVRKLRDAPPSMLDELIRSITGLAPRNGHSGHHDKKVEELPRFRRKRKVSQQSPDNSYIHTCRKRTVPRRLQDTSYIQTNKESIGSPHSPENRQNPKRRKVSKHSTNCGGIRSPLTSKLRRNVPTLQSEPTNAPEAAVGVEHKKIKLRISMKTASPKVMVSIDEMREANNAEDVMKERSPGLDIAHELKESDPKDGGSISTMQQENDHGIGKKKKDTSLHKLVFMSDGLPDGTELAYFIRGQKLLEGFKQRNGIVCSCCNTVVSPSQFEAHAGWASRRQPYHYICTSSGLSLHEICVSLSKGRKLSARYNDDLCTMCGDGGDLLLCDGCPRAFHAGCLEEERLPNTSWYCKYCKEKAVHGSALFSGDPPSNALPGCNLEERKAITIRSKRVIKAPTTVIGGCVVCRRHDFSKGRFGERTVILCDQCEKEFHVGCLRDAGLCNLEALPKGKWFCNETCSNIHSQLNQLIVHGPAKLPDSASSIIARKSDSSEDECLSNIQTNVEWQLLSGRTASPRNRMLLSRAAAIFRDCFDPIVEISGRDLIPAMVYGRNVGGREFGGMCCAVLIVNSVVVSAGLLRIFGQEVAELPVVATCREYQGQGYFQSLFSCIQSLLSDLNVKNLVLPAAEDAESMWTKKFGFNKLTDEQLRKYTKDLPMMVFQGTAMLEKELLQ